MRRVTVDEWLSDDLVRLLVAPLAEGVETITDRTEDWGPEREVLVTPETYARRLGIRTGDLPWQALGEGQVYLMGAFEVIGKTTAPDGFRLCRAGRAVQRIDHLPLVKDPVKRAYSALVRGEGARDG